MVEFNLDDYEKEVAFFLAEQFHDGTHDVAVSDFPRTDEIGNEQVQDVIKRFENYGWIRLHNKGSMILPTSATITEQLIQAVEHIKNPPPKDYWIDCITWLRSKRWSVPVFVIAIVLPLVVQWIEMIQDVLNWFSVVE